MNHFLVPKTSVITEKEKASIRIYTYKRIYLATPSISISVAESSEEYLDPNLAGLRRCHLYILDHQRLIRFPCNRSFVFDTKFTTKLGFSHIKKKRINNHR